MFTFQQLYLTLKITTFFWGGNLKVKFRLNDLPQLPSLWHSCGDELAIRDAPCSPRCRYGTASTAASGSREEIDYWFEHLLGETLC